MADDNLFGGDTPDEKKRKDEESGLGNLPPLSDFDSGGGLDADAELPPLGNFETRDPAADAFGGLPPLSDISLETPNPAGGNIKPAPPGFEFSPTGNVSSMGMGRGGAGFQDLAADSDFSPETPDIGPGPDSSLETPIFDSAFGPADSGFSFGNQTPAPTQAMETPVFNEPDFGGGEAIGGGAGAFGGGANATGGTPVPDFGPDTGFGGFDANFDIPSGRPAAVGAGASAGPSQKSGKAGGAKKGGSPLVAIVLILIAAGAGIVASPFLADYLTFLPNPKAAQVTELENQVSGLQSQVNKLQNLPKSEQGGVEISPQRAEELLREITAKTQQLDQVTGQLDSTNATLQEKQSQLAGVEQQIADKNEEFANAQAVYDDLRNETAIIQARQRGLVAEVDRLTGLVGELEEANVRRVATKEALEHNVDRLLILVKESMPLTPQKYDHAARLASVQQLREKAAASNWVSPELQEEYTSMYLRELEIARSNEYFFAHIQVTDQFGSKVQKWAECLMRGNWGVYYRTLDGQNVGVFENTGTTDTPKWSFREDLPEESRKGLEATIIASRVKDFQNKVQMLAEREIASQGGTSWQRNFDSL